MIKKSSNIREVIRDNLKFFFVKSKQQKTTFLSALKRSKKKKVHKQTVFLYA